jgi:hypothetical protein
MSRSSPLNNTTAIADTGASSHYLRPQDPHNTTGANKTPITVRLPNGTMLQSTTEACQLALSQLPEQAREAHIMPGLTHSSLLSIGKLCDAGCKAIFTEHEVKISHNDQVLLTQVNETRTALGSGAPQLAIKPLQQHHQLQVAWNATMPINYTRFQN